MKNRMNRMNRFNVERLESRQLLAVTVGVSQGILSINGDNFPNDIEVYQSAPGAAVQVLVEGVDKTPANANSAILVSIKSYGGDDVVYNNTYIDSVISLGNGDDRAQGGGKNDRIFAGNGDDILSDFITNEQYVPIGAFTQNVLSGENGNDQIWAGWGRGDIILGGNGVDRSYSIVGGSNYIDLGAGADFAIARGGLGLATNPISGGGFVVDTVITDKADRPSVLFDAATQVGADSRANVVVQNSVLYVVNALDPNPVVVVASPAGKNKVALTLNGVTKVYSGVTTIAGLGSAQADVFINNTNLPSVFYGQGAGDYLQGGSSKLGDVLKGGAGNDFIVSGTGGNSDISGDAGFDMLISLNGKRDIVRFDFDAINNVYLDLVVNDLVDTLFAKRIRLAKVGM